MSTPIDMGYLLEGVLEQDPLTDRFYLRTEDAQGRPVNIDLQEAMGKYIGKEVRFTLASFETLGRLAALVEEQGGGQVFGLKAEDIVPK
jgi:hypothetical protein